jgi:hypothetical protein
MAAQESNYVNEGKERRENQKASMKHQGNYVNESSMKEGEKMETRKRQCITVLALGFIIVLLVACGAKETPAPAPTEAPAAAATPTTAPAATEPPAATEEAAATEPPAAPSGDEKSVIAKSAADLKNLKSYRVKMTMEQEGQTMETLVEYALPDRFHMVSDLAEMIVIGDDMYMKAGDTWTKVPGGGAGAAVADVGVTEDQILEARLEGSEDVEGVPCQKYVYTAKVGDNPPIEVTAWIGAEDGLPYKVVTEMESGMTMTQILYDFNADITIEPPPGVE